MNDERRSRRLPWQRLVTGLTILALGILFWLDRIGNVDAHEYLRWWPVAALAMGVAHLLDRRWFGAAIWLIIGMYFGLPLIGFPGAEVWHIIGVWPLLISVGGVMLMMQALRASERPSVNAIAVMAGNVRRVGGRFTGGSAIAVMGGCDIDLTAAQLESGAVIDVLAFWGGIGIRVPRGWKVIDRVAPILGGVEDKTDGASDDAPRLIVRGAAIMGGIDVRHPKESAG